MSLASNMEPMLAGARDLIYRIDALDRLCDVNAEWEAFACANSGDGVAPGQVLGRSLWSFVKDPSMSQVYRYIVADARQGRELRLRCRCDAPTERRLLEMTVTGEVDGAVQFRTRPVALAPRPREALLDAGTMRNGMPVRICSWCNRVWAGDGWVEVEVAVERLHLMLRSVLPPLSHVACDSCLQTIQHEMDRHFAAGRALRGRPLLFSLGDDPRVLGAA